MNIKDMFRGILGGKNGELFDVFLKTDADKLAIESLAIARAVNLIASTIAKTELQVHVLNSQNKIEEKKNELYYRINIKPNDNETGTEFVKKIVLKLFESQEVLIIPIKKSKKTVPYLFVAEDFNKSTDIINAKKFSNIRISDGENELELKKDFSSSDALYLKLKNEKVKEELSNFYKRYEKLLKNSYKKFLSDNINKWRLKNPGSQVTLLDPITKQPISYEDYKKQVTKGLFDEDESIVMLSEQFGLEKLNSEKGVNSEDYRNMIKDIFDKVAMVFDIPLDVFYGSKTEKSNGTNDFITQACEPVMQNIEDGMNDSYVGEESYLKGEKIIFNRFCMQHMDITTLGTALDKMTGIGFSFNQLCRMLNLPEVDESWANEHHVTKNYADVKGGAEKNE